MEESVNLFKALADQSRLRILTSLMENPMYVELLAQRLELSPSTVSFHLKKLEASGLVSKEKDQYYIVYHINKEILEKSLSSLIKPDEKNSRLEDDREAAYRKKIIETFFNSGKLKSIPVQRKKRRVILEQMVEAFAYDQKYTEKEVNGIIVAFHDDFATLRREFIMEKLMSRENGIYWRNQGQSSIELKR